MPSKALDKARDIVKGRLAELEDERTRLERALSELDGKTGGTGRRPGRPRTVGRPAGRPAKKAAAAKPRRTRRRRRGNTRADQAVKLVEKNPGISASEIAKSMKIKPNYLYRVLSDLEKEGRVKKQGRKYQPGAAK